MEPILKIENAGGEEKLEIDTLHAIAHIAIHNVQNGKKTSAAIELTKEDMKSIIDVLPKLCDNPNIAW